MALLLRSLLTAAVVVLAVIGIAELCMFARFDTEGEE
jgi:hypothetical protein